jgi:hypothetical protein
MIALLSLSLAAHAGDLWREGRVGLRASATFAQNARVEPITCFDEDDAGRTEQVVGERHLLTFVADREAAGPGALLVAHPSSASVDQGRRLAEYYRSRRWTIDAAVSSNDSVMRWNYNRGDANVRIRRTQPADGVYVVELRLEQPASSKCRAYPPAEGWHTWDRFRELVRHHVAWEIPGPEDQPAAATLHRRHKAGQSLETLMDHYRYGVAALGDDRPFVELLDAGAEADRTALTALDHRAAWDRPSGRGAFRVDGCYRALDAATAAPSPFRDTVYPKTLSYDDAFPLVARPGFHKVFAVEVVVAPDGTVTDATLPLPRLDSPKKAHARAMVDWHTCMDDALTTLRYPPALQPRSGRFELHYAPAGLTLAPLP